jgi:hypothetical protein
MRVSDDGAWQAIGRPPDSEHEVCIGRTTSSAVAIGTAVVCDSRRHSVKRCGERRIFVQSDSVTPERA